MTGFLDAMLLIIGTLAFGGACAMVVTPWLTRHWSRRWTRIRLGIIVYPQLQKGIPQNAVVSDARRHNKIAPSTQEVTDFLDSIARDVRSGFSLASSFVQCSDRLADQNHWSVPIAQRCMRGSTLSDAIDECATPNWSSEIQMACRTLSVCAAGGGGVARGIEHCAVIFREQHGLQLDRTVQTSQAQLSTKILTWLPVVVFIWVVVTDHVARAFLLSTPAGMGCVATGITLNVTGRRWMNHLSRFQAL